MEDNKQKSNMYDWVTTTRNYLAGECRHNCSFCYVEDFKKRYPQVRERYSGGYRLIEKELEKNEGSGKIIFVQDCGDLFEIGVPSQFIKRIIEHCRKFDNTYLFQTKNPKRFSEFIFPEKTILGISLESNRDYKLTKAPRPKQRVNDFYEVSFPNKMLNLEPIIDFDLDIIVDWIGQIKPQFVSIGADSKNKGLPEPTKEKVDKLIKELEKFTQVKIKNNLRRLK